MSGYNAASLPRINDDSMVFDLHSHTTASDGELDPCDLLARARANGVTCLAITDHDTVAAYGAVTAAARAGVDICYGIELSANWHGRSIHVVGLNIQTDCEVMRLAVSQQQQARLERAGIIAARLASKGFDGALAGARGIAGSDNIGRPHFAKFLVSIAAVRDERQAFRKYLGRGKAGDVHRGWPTVAAVVAWIRDAGGTAVLAHPAHYQLTNTRLGILADEFVAAGGGAIEVVSGRQLPELTRKLADLANAKCLLASSGSDFHRPGQPWSELGQQSALPGNVRPVWDAW
jgi:hypothetical protein